MSIPFDVAVVDLETTGLRPADSILQVAVVCCPAQGSSFDQWCTYVRPPRVLTASLGPTQIHGIKRRNVLFAPSLESTMRRLADLTRDRVVVAHNAPFDVGFIRAAAERVGVSLAWAGVLCTLDLSQIGRAHV